MFFSHLIHYIIFIILFSKNGVLSGGEKKTVHFSNEPIVKSFKKQDPPSKINNPNLMIHWGGENVKIYDPDEPSKTINKTRYDLYSHHKGKYLVRDPYISGLLKQVDKLSINGKIWRFVWKHCVVYSSFSFNRFATLKNNFLIEMNLYRKLHGSLPLKLDPHLSDEALEAAKLFFKNGKSLFRRRSTNGVHYKKIHFTVAPLLVNMWYKECRNYNFRRPGPQLQTSHFVNLIWRSTTKVGIGIVKNDSYLYICFIFSPSGNLRKKFRENVGRARYHLLNSRSFFRM